jgi:hypothetical protein
MVWRGGASRGKVGGTRDAFASDTCREQAKRCREGKGRGGVTRTLGADWESESKCRGATAISRRSLARVGH